MLKKIKTFKTVNMVFKTILCQISILHLFFLKFEKLNNSMFEYLKLRNQVIFKKE